MISVTGCGGATSAKDAEVLTLVPGPRERLGSLSRREDALGVFLCVDVPRRAHDEYHDADRAEDNDEVKRFHEQDVACPPDA
jgi:hypothetical protein